MMSMTHTNFDPESHPRSASNGRFTESAHSAPEASLPGNPLRSSAAQSAIDEITGGRAVLEREVRSGVFSSIELMEAQKSIWERAGGPKVRGTTLERHLDTADTELTPDAVERILDVAYHRAASGRYTVNAGSSIEVTPVDENELSAADRLAGGRSEHVAAMWENGQEVGPESEISDHAARLFAEHALQNRPKHLPIHLFPRLAEFAVAPYTEASDASPEKIDALHAEIFRLREGQGALSPRTRLRHDTLATFATHAIPGQV